MKCKSFMLGTLLIFALPSGAQQQKPALVAEDGDLQERGSARVLYWNPREEKAHGQFAIDYGRPAWKKEYEDPAKFDGMTKGKVWRLGRDFWTVLDTGLPLRIAGKAVAAGSYYLGLHRSADGATWSLAFIDPVKVRSAHLDAFQIDRAPILFQVPMIQEPSTEMNEKLKITLSYTKEKPKNVKLRIAWGKILLTAPIEVSVGS